jgi:hypothetical protein
VVSGWIAEQADYHAGNARRKHAAARRAHVAGLTLFALAFLLAVLHGLGVGHGATGEWAGRPLLGLALACLAVVLPAWGATVYAIDTLLERERIAARSRRMATVLKALAGRAAQAPSLGELREAVARAEEVMATEVHEWAVSLSFRDLVLPG